MCRNLFGATFRSSPLLGVMANMLHPLASSLLCVAAIGALGCNGGGDEGGADARLDSGVGTTSDGGDDAGRVDAGADAPGGVPSGSLFPDTLGSGATNGSEPRVATDGSGRVHMLYTGFTADAMGAYPVRYGVCVDDCSSLAAWTFITLADHGVLGGGARLAVDAQGHVSVAFSRQLAPTSPHELVVATCDASCAALANWQLAPVLDLGASSSYLPGPGDNLVIDGQGRLRMAFFGSATGLIYGECDGGCVDAGSWTWTQLTTSFRQVALALTAAGQPRLALSDNTTLFYAECDSACTTPASWSSTALFYASSPHFAIRVDTQGRPRIAWNQGATGIAGQEQLDDVVIYGWCDASCAEATGWSAFTVGLAAGDGTEGVDLTLLPDGSPVIAASLRAAPNGIGVAACSGGCNTGSATWNIGRLDPADELTASTPPPLPSCSGTTPEAFWYTGEQPALVVNAARNTVDAVDRTYALQRCGSNGTISEGVSFPRFTRIAW